MNRFLLILMLAAVSLVAGAATTIAPGGTGKPAAVDFARLAPLPPAISTCCASGCGKGRTRFDMRDGKGRRGAEQQAEGQVQHVVIL